MNPLPTLQTLPIDCIIEIASYLPLPECMFLRSSSRQLKVAVDEHFRTGVRVLPVVLSARYLPESFALFDEYCQQEFKHHEEQFERIAYGSTSGVSQLGIYDDKAKYQVGHYEPYSRSENFLTLFDLSKFNQFVDFITKYLPGITKLALIIDHEDHMNNVSTILNLYRKQLKVLFVERTARSAMELEYNQPGSVIYNYYPMKIVQKHPNSKEINFSAEFYQSIDGLEVLEELHFFPKANNLGRYNDDEAPMLEKSHFLMRMLRKLKVLYFRDYHNYWNDLFDADYYRSAVFENVEKLICNDFTSDIWLKASFSRLETLILGHGLIYNLEPENMPSLRTIGITHSVMPTDEEMETLNKFPKLERIHCREMDPYGYLTVMNRSIKFIEIEILQNADYRLRFSDEEALKELKECLRHFQSLEKVIVQEPFMELTGSDLQHILE